MLCMKKIVKLTALLLAALFVAALFPAAPLVPTAQAVTQEEIDELEEEAKNLKRQRKQVEQDLASLRDDRSTMLQRINLLTQQINITQDEIAVTESKIAGFDVLLAQTAYELDENQKEEERCYALFCERARVMEEAGTVSYWAVLFQAESFSDLLGRLSDIQEVLNYDQSVLDNLRDIRAQIQEKQATQEDLKADMAEAKATLEEQEADLESQREESNALVEEIEANIEEYQELWAQLDAEEDAIQDEILEKTEELARQMGWGQASAGGYIWPVSTSKRITSPMGGRNTGIPGASTNHKGVDIGGVYYTSEIYATKAGVVIKSELSSSYGNYVVISHGTGNTTLYAHMSKRLVKEGDVVSQGLVIGITGCTGISNGPHLHYEITENGSRVDPLQYLPGYIQAW